MILESELVIAKVKRKTIEVFKTNLDNKRNKINMLDKKLDKKKAKTKHFKEKNRLLECHSQMINTYNTQLNKNNMLLLEKKRNMDE
jgi:5-bromo-4-chloroindolyl phosphate hydrolysis protein